LGQYANSVASDNQGNIFVTGHFYGQTWFGNELFESKGETDMFLAKYGPDGSLHWVKIAGGESNDAGAAICADTKGGIYLTGFFHRMALFDQLALDSGEAVHSYVAKFTSEGHIKWIRDEGERASDIMGYSICLDQHGNVYTTANAWVGSPDFSPTIYLSKYTSLGNRLWTQAIGNDVSNWAENGTVFCDAFGNLNLEGSLAGKVNFGKKRLTGTGLFLARLSE
jgi:hypothetical protein